MTPFFPFPSLSAMPAMPTMPATPTWGADLPAAKMWEQIGSVYQHAFQQNAQELWTSSARIIQEHVTRAWIEASQSCMTALAQNASAIQQRAFASMLGASQQAATIVTDKVVESLADSVAVH